MLAKQTNIRFGSYFAELAQYRHISQANLDGRWLFRILTISSSVIIPMLVDWPQWFPKLSLPVIKSTVKPGVIYLSTIIRAMSMRNYLFNFYFKSVMFNPEMENVIRSRFRALVLLLLHAYEPTMAAKTTSSAFGRRQSRRKVTDGWLTICK